MSSEACPFCGKTYKRLKSHLPHCKAAANSKTAPTQHDVETKQTSSSQLATASSQTTPKIKKSMQTPSVTADLQTKKSKKVSVVSCKPLQLSTPAMPFKSVNTSSASQLLSLSTASTKKKKQKLADQIKMANTPSSPSSSPSPVFSKPKKKNSLRALIEAARAEQVSLEGTTSVSPDLVSGSTLFLTDSLNTRTSAQVETKMNPKTKDLVKDVPTKKVPKVKRAAEFLSTAKNASDSLDTNINETSARPHIEDNLWVDSEEEIEDLSIDKLLMKSRSGHQGRITLQDVKATLRRAKTSSQSNRTSILSQIETDLSSKSRLGTSLSPVIVPAESQKDNCLVAAKTLSDQLSSNSSQFTELQSVRKKSLMSEQTSLIPPEHDASPQPKLTSPATPLLSGHLSSHVSQPAPLSHTDSLSEGLKAGRHMTGLLSVSPASSQFSSPHPFLLATTVRVETLKADEGLTPEKSQLSVRKQNTAHSHMEGALTQRHLGQVRLSELPEWLACKTPRNPRDVVEMVQRGWQWYYRRYIDVKKGGVGGVGMLLAGYCVLSYIWSYPHIKRDRWRKYH